MLTFFLYGILAFLLATERATSTVYYISASWLIMFLDMSCVLYESLFDIITRPVDLCFHLINLVSTFDIRRFANLF